MTDVPKEWPTWDIQVKEFGADLTKICSTLMRAAMSDGVDEGRAVSAVVTTLLNCAAGAACRNAVNILGREPSAAKWRAAADKAFEKAVKRTVAASTPTVEAKS